MVTNIGNARHALQAFRSQTGYDEQSPHPTTASMGNAPMTASEPTPSSEPSLRITATDHRLLKRSVVYCDEIIAMQECHGDNIAQDRFLRYAGVAVVEDASPATGAPDLPRSCSKDERHQRKQS